MILLDTNVASELMKTGPDAGVSAWKEQQQPGTLFLSSVTLAELLDGVVRLPEGRRKQGLQDAVDRLLDEFGQRILPFDALAAYRYAELHAAARAGGRGFPLPDAYIAAIASSCNFIVASRDTGPYLAGGIEVVNPWEARAR